MKDQIESCVFEILEYLSAHHTPRLMALYRLHFLSVYFRMEEIYGWDYWNSYLFLTELSRKDSVIKAWFEKCATLGVCMIQ